MMNDRTRQQRATLAAVPLFTHVGHVDPCAACIAGVVALHPFEAETFHAGPWLAHRDGSESVTYPVACWCGMDPHPCGQCIDDARHAVAAAAFARFTQEG